MGNFPNFGDFEDLIGKKLWGEFPIHVMGNFDLVKFCGLFFKTLKQVDFKLKKEVINFFFQWYYEKISTVDCFPYLVKFFKIVF